jgi:hypothetical protein
MAWDSTRPIPWERLLREWVIYAVIMTVVFLLLFRDGNVVGAIAGVLVSGPLYLGFGAVLAKMGYQRKTMKELRSSQASKDTETKGSSSSASSTSNSRGRPAPTSRTATGPNRPVTKKRRR